MIRFKVKPLSVNQAFKGKRFRTGAARLFFDRVILAWRELKKSIRPNLPKKGHLFVHYRYGVSNMGTDADNPTKSFQDALFFALGENDKRVRFMLIEKVKAPKSEEFIDWHVDSEALLIPYLERLIADLKRADKKSTQRGKSTAQLELDIGEADLET